MSATAGEAAGQSGPAERLGMRQGQVVQEIGWDEDSDEGLRQAIEELTGSELVDEDYGEVVDAVVIWWREDDGDLFDVLLASKTDLADGGVVWLLTPKVGRDGYVDASDIAEVAPIAGLAQTSSVSVAPDWSGTRLVAPKGRGR